MDANAACITHAIETGTFIALGGGRGAYIRVTKTSLPSDDRRLAPTGSQGDFDLRYVADVRAPFRIAVARDRYKFSCAHMTVFPDGRKERLHGHNYYLAVAIDLLDVSFANMIDFAPIKSALAALCEEWKEHLLLAGTSPFYQVVKDTDVEIEFTLCEKRYVIPREDVVVLPIDNISVEALASHAADRLLDSLRSVFNEHVVGMEVRVEENPGQGASCYRALESV